MEDDEVEISNDELQKLITETVEKVGLISPDFLEKCNLLQSLLEMREKRNAKVLKLWESVAGCEAAVKNLYSLLGWEYRDTDSEEEDDDDNNDDDDAGTGYVTEVPSAFVSSALSQCNNKDTQNLHHVSGEEVTVNMIVVARRRHLNWQRGEIKEIITKEDGSLKYKVIFSGNATVLVPGYHIAYDHMPKVEQLFVGARVVVKRNAEHPLFCPGVIIELPSKMNISRFLVFFDDHTPVYVGLAQLHLVYKPLTDPVDDIEDVFHKDFMKLYLQSWPDTPKVHYVQGQLTTAEFNGVKQKCTVCKVDCSLIEVVFEEDQHKEWIYRGSLRLENVILMRSQMKINKKSTRKSTRNQQERI